MKYKSFLKFLTEMPLPKDMDPEGLTPSRGKYEKSVEGGRDQLRKFGKQTGEDGSSRAAYRVSVEGSQFTKSKPEKWGGTKEGSVDTVIKIALNSNGIAQNNAEIQAYKKFKKNPLILPIIDDSARHKVRVILKGKKRNNQGYPNWIQMPYAEQIMDDAKFGSALKHHFGDIAGALMDMDPEEYTHRYYLQYFFKYTYLDGLKKLQPSKYIDHEQFTNLQALLTLVKSGLKIGDLSRPANWGFWQGKPYILDYGFDDSTLGLYTGTHDAQASVDDEGNIHLNITKIHQGVEEDSTDAEDSDEW